MSDQLDELKNLRRVTKSSITRQETFLKSYNPSPETVSLIQNRIKDLNNIFQNYNDYQTRIERLLLKDVTDDAEIAALEKSFDEERMPIETQYFTLTSKMQNIITKNSQYGTSNNTSDQQPTFHITNAPGNTKTSLKPIPLPTFGGKYSEWVSFFDSFQSLVHNDISISKIGKFHYLRGCLTGEALKCVETLSVSNDNYDNAIELLKNRFENKRIIIMDHLSNIVNMPALSKTSHTQLRELIDTVNNNVSALRTLETNITDIMLIAILQEKLDFYTKKEWVSTLSKTIPTYTDFQKFLEKRCEILESMQTLNKSHLPTNRLDFAKPINKHNNFSKVNYSSKPQNAKYNTNIVTSLKCLMCNATNHLIFQCSDFKSLSVTDRINHVNMTRLCANCLKTGHKVENCLSSKTCRECHKRHHTLIHINSFQPSTSANTLIVQNANQVLLPTALIKISDAKGKFHTCRAVLDQCSEVSLITSHLQKKLQLKPFHVETTISGVSLAEHQSAHCVKLTLKSTINDFTANLECHILKQITRPMPPISFEQTLLTIPNNIELADPNFNITQEVDVLIGAKLFWQLLIGAPKQFKNDQPYFQETTLGWIVGGNLELINPAPKSAAMCNLIQNNSFLESQVEKFWQQEDVGYLPITCSEHLECEKHYQNNTFRESNGQFVVRLPFKQNACDLKDSHSHALNHFLNLEKRLSKNKELKSLYTNFMREYKLLEHMEFVNPVELEKPGCYLPHFAVFKRTLDGPKIRVVFNASATNANLSLNNILMTGPTIQDDIFSLLSRFRTFQFVMSADIVKMYRMVLLHPDDRDFHRIFWRESPKEPIQIFRLKTVTYGTTCAPFLAVRSLQETANFTDDPLISTIIKRDFYIDDLLTGSNSLEEAKQMKLKLSNLLQSFGFKLSQWCSNHQSLMSDSNQLEAADSQSLNFGDNQKVKVLGFFWNCNEDYVTYNVNLPSNKLITKRTILAITAQLYDPLGLVNPVVVPAKILIQSLWSEKIEWDEEVTENFQAIWKSYLNNLIELNEFKIPRYACIPNPTSVQLHGFADASMKAYGAAVYLRMSDTFGNISINLISAKSRVAPLKKVTLPRLELSGALLLTKLLSKIKNTLDLNCNQIFYWTDSTIVLHWIAEPASSWKQYVANRVADIQLYTHTQNWNYVPSADNPADLVSRGALPKNLKTNALWWHGPSWLKSNLDCWPQGQFNKYEPNNVPERQPVVVHTTVADKEHLLFTKFSSFVKLQRIVALIFRFFNKLKHSDSKTTGYIRVTELKKAQIAILRYIQDRHFKKEMQILQLDDLDKKRQILRKSRLIQLDPFLDLNGLLRVGGRLKFAPLNYDTRFPILLPKEHKMTETIMAEIHESELHAGPLATLAAVRQTYWPVGGRNLAKKIVKRCIVCSRADPVTTSTKMGDLPSNRVQPNRPFYISGVDYAGPFTIKDGSSKNARKVKVYIALFICFSTKAVHLELVGNLTTDNFLAALKRFISRRGMVSEIYSDNGTNFVGAEREIIRHEKFQNKILKTMAELNSIKFHFIPARSPHFGGLWERGVKSVKHHLHRVLKNTSLTFEEFYTLLTAIEACLNSRPITPLSEDPNDLQALTPGHFLIGAPLTAPVEPDLGHLSPGRLSRWQKTEQVRQHFWKRWQREYLSQLQIRSKDPLRIQENITVGSLVVLVEDNLPPQHWRLGRVTAVHPGADDIVRVVTVKTHGGHFKRAIKKVCVLPIEC